MNLPIYAYGHPVLRKRAENITADYPNLAETIANMWDTMYHARGMGLAAPQVGLSIRLFVVDSLQLDEEDKEGNASACVKQVFINAEIVEEAGKEWAYEEGCLSIPNIRGKVTRQPQVRIKFQDENFQWHDKVFDGITARIIQHEYDHIDGVLFTDHVSMLKKQLIRKQLDRISKGQITTKYKMIFP